MPRLSTTLRMRAIRAKLLDDVEQLNLENERGASRDSDLVQMTVGDRRRAGQFRLLARLHPLQALGPAGNDLGQRELGRLAALDRAVKDGAVDERTLIVHLDLVGHFRARAGARLEGSNNQPRAGLDR